MKRRILAGLLVLSLALSGCGWSGGRYTSVTPHREQRQNTKNEAVSAANYLELIQVLMDMIEGGQETAAISVSQYPEGQLNSTIDLAMDYVMTTYPLGAYAVEKIDYELGTSGGLPAVAVTFHYRHSDVEIRQIKEVEKMTDAQPLVAAALEDYDASLVMDVERYTEMDFQQMVRDHAETYPELVMEVPQVTTAVYGSGQQRLVELRFAYQTSRDALRQMQNQVKPVFEAAELYVSGDGIQRQKYSQLYAFLMERFDFKVETSITPAYSLLHHGVGDSRAFATVYAAMCRRAGLDCLVVTGTRSGEPWVWNIISENGIHQHVDLLQCSIQGRFQEKSDREMGGYVWDYSAYPECPVIRPPEAPEQEIPVQETPEATEPAQEETAPATQPEEVPEPTQEATVPVQTEAPEEPEEKSEEI